MKKLSTRTLLFVGMMMGFLGFKNAQIRIEGIVAGQTHLVDPSGGGSSGGPSNFSTPMK